ncbi:putative component of NuA3 histone acetyltransferase complex [Malassezia sp. CBS 17886]|nr:putative component of NuA3 histone acetyltransferase complex [Malassezia sp. CBS 17886]
MAATAAKFEPDIFSDAFIAQKHAEYTHSTPYRHAVVDGLISDDLLRRAREEIIEELHFTEKETDIYKVNQTGDLANLDGLPEAEVQRLRAVLEVRNAMYSAEFRAWIQRVTGCGPLSAEKKDMSINDYRSGCHLLTHDDVISTRRVSYILYLTDPAEAWQPAWGGALELYPVSQPRHPEPVPTRVIPPRWNQYTLFAVQPGHSFHSVEEVVHPAHSRLSISGWFHRLQPNEPGFSPEAEAQEVSAEKELSSLESLSSRDWTSAFLPYPDAADAPLPGSPLPREQVRFLAHFLNPAYLTGKTQSTLFDKFGDESHLLLSEFLRQDVAEAIERALRKKDEDDGLVWWENRKGATKVSWDAVRVLPHAVGTGAAGAGDDAWVVAGPPHRERYATLAAACTPADAPAVDYASAASPLAPIPTSAAELLHILTHVLFPSLAFRHLVANITQLIPLAARPFRVRRFRPGLDYTLARADDDPVLDVTLTLTPDAVGSARKAQRRTAKPRGGIAAKRGPVASGVLSKSDVDRLDVMWESGDIGGWECYMAPHEGEEDPAVYQSGAKKAAGDAVGGGGEDAGGDEADGDGEGGDGDADEDDGDEDEDDEFDGVLLNVTPSFNTLNVVLRDEGVMRFVKYLGAGAGGSRWDIAAEYSVGAAELEEDA